MDKIMIVDDDKDMQFVLSGLMSSEGYEAITSCDGRKALKEIRMHLPDLVMLDVKLPGMNGMEILEEIKEVDKYLPVMIFTAYEDVKDAVRCMKLGAFDYVTKPFDNEELLISIKKALQMRPLSKEVENLRKRVEEKTAIEKFIGESSQVKQVLKQVETIADTNMTVIIQGESGTGKELIARMIHQISSRHNKPFVTVDCGTLPESLIESELYGYERGAFTGADRRKGGKFEEANGGTLFLDEITNLPIELQPKLLRVIQERKIMRLGNTKEITIDVRIIAASNINMSEIVTKGQFRNDLYHRLNEFNITISPLIERKEDIPLLARYFVEEACLEFNKKIKGISSEALESLFQYSWPGNVRELRNIIRRSVLLTDSEYIREVNIPRDVTSNCINGEFLEDFDNDIPLREINKKVSEKLETKLITKALKKANNNKSKAAKILKIDRMTLYSKIRSLGL